MDKRLSEFDDIFILFMKIKRESCSQLDSKTNTKDGNRKVYALINTKIHFFQEQLLFCQDDYGHFVSKV